MTTIIPMHKKEDLELKKDLIKRTVCKGATDDELQLFIHVCKHTGLDPFMKQIHAVKRGDVMTIQTGIDGLRLIADRTGNYSPGREPSFQYDEDGRLKSSTAYIKKRTPDGVWHEVAATAFLKEYRPSYKNNFWDTKEHIMLPKCAEALALRKAFPAEMASVYSDEEMPTLATPKEENLEDLKQEILDNLQPPEGEKFLSEYVSFVETKLPKTRKLSEVMRSWLDNPAVFLNHYKNWIGQNSSRHGEEEVVNI